jgi:hypothetical protein
MGYQIVPVQGLSSENRRKRMPPRCPASLRGRLSFLPCQLAVAVTCLLFWTVTCLFASAESKAGAIPCDYYTKEDAQKLFGVLVSGPIQKKTSLPAGQSCRYTFPYKGGTCGLTLSISTTSDIAEEGLFESAKDQMERQKRTRMSHQHASKSFKAIPGLGDDAFWTGKTLWVLKGETLMIITVHSALEGSFPNRTAADQAKEEQDLALSQQIAATVLSRLP